MPWTRESSRTASRTGVSVGGAEIGATVVQALVLGEQLRPVAPEALEEVLARSGLKVEDVRPDAACAGLAGGAHDLGELLGPVGDAGEDRRHPHRRPDPRADELLEGTQALPWRGGSGLGEPPDLDVESRHREGDRDLGAASGVGEHVEVPDDHRPAGDEPERVCRLGEHLDAGPGEPEAPLGGLIGVGGRTDRDALALPRRPAELGAQHLGDVLLHPDRGAVGLAGRPVGAPLERAHVTERAAVHAAHVRVERPVERHPGDAVQRTAAGLDPILDPHAGTIEHTFASAQVGADGSDTMSTSLDDRPNERRP